jgi:nicotinamidase/pyrazinamidase
MPFPDLYQPEQAGELYAPRKADLIEAGAQLDLPSAAEDARSVGLLLVDAQIDFIHPQGALPVPGAVEDTRRTIEWIYRNLAQLTTVFASLDSHLPLQIFYPTWWQGRNGGHPDPYTTIRAREVEAGDWRPLFEPEWSVSYVHELERASKKELMIWPYHTMIGDRGHDMMPALYEAVLYHAAARRSQPQFVQKGTIAKTEYYSLLEPEVKVADDPAGRLNGSLLDRLLGVDLLYVVGQAKSHCVLETLASIFRYRGDDSTAVARLRLLDDCTSSVQHPEVDFEAIAEEALREFEDRGLIRVNSDDPIG